MQDKARKPEYIAIAIFRELKQERLRARVGRDDLSTGSKLGMRELREVGAKEDRGEIGRYSPRAGGEGR